MAIDFWITGLDVDGGTDLTVVSDDKIKPHAGAGSIHFSCK